MSEDEISRRHRIKREICTRILDCCDGYNKDMLADCLITVFFGLLADAHLSKQAYEDERVEHEIMRYIESKFKTYLEGIRMIRSGNIGDMLKEG